MLIKEKKIHMYNVHVNCNGLNPTNVWVRGANGPTIVDRFSYRASSEGACLVITDIKCIFLNHMFFFPHTTQNHTTTLGLSRKTYIFPLCIISVTRYRIPECWIWIGLCLDIWSAALNRGVWKDIDCRGRHVSVQCETKSCEVWESALPADDQRQA